MAFEQAFSRHLNERSREGAEPKKKLKKKRSIKFSNGSWFRLSSKSSKSRFNGAPDGLPSENSTVQPPSLDALSDSSPSYMKSTTSLNAQKESSRQEIDSDDANSLVSSSCGSSDVVVVPVTENRSSLEVSDASPPAYSESSYDSSDNGKSSHNAHSKSGYSGHRTLPTLSRSSSKRAVRIFIKKSGSNPRRTPLKNSEMSEHVNVERATCSSIIKDSRFPQHVELEAGQAESEVPSVVRVCPYHHCSLNGHCHDPPVPKKPFLRRKRPSSLPQKVAKLNSVSGPEAKRSADMKKGSKQHPMASNAELVVHDASLMESGEQQGSSVLDGQSDPEKTNQELQKAGKNSSAEREDRSEGTSEVKDTSLEFHSQKTEVEKSKAPGLSLGSQKTPLSKGKPISMWHLIHKHMVSGVAAEEETKPHQGSDETRQVEEAEMATTSSNVSPDHSDSDIGNSNQDIEVRKLFAIKLVREAIEKILLPEVQDQLSENQSITGESVEGQELTEKNHQEAHDEGVVHESETAQVRVDGIATEETKKPETQLGKKSDKKSPSNWSNLKKWVLLQRFVKELEKVRKINYRKPRQLQSEAETSADKVSLRRQTVDEKKKGEEWMLDYALQQVVSQLAPTQRRKVALLVKAFETVVPPQEDSGQATAKANVGVVQEDGKPKADSQAPKPDGLESSVCRKHSDAEKEGMPELFLKSVNRDASSADVALGKAPGKINVKELFSFKTENINGISESSVGNEDINVASERSYEFQTKSGNVEAKSGADQELTSKDEDTADNSSKKTELEEHELTTLRPSSEHSCAASVPSTNEELGDGNYRVDEPFNTSVVDKIDKAPTVENLAHSTLEQEASTWKEETKSESMPEHGVVQGIPPHLTKTYSGVNDAAQFPLDKEAYLNMWHLVCQHVVSSIATKLVLDGDDEETEEASESPSPGERRHKAEFSRSQVLKLVKEAVQEIQDESSDTLSTSSEIPPDPELSEKDDNEGAKQGISGSDGFTKQKTGEIEKSKEGSTLGEEKELATDVITTRDSQNAESMDNSTNDPPKAKNWRKLKKLLLLKRSIKAMEQARKLKFRPQQLLPLPSDQGPEKVDLRHQMMDERRKAEQWMLDYAVQHIVTKLTPARKKRVAMLVEAFEAVVPLPDM